MLAESAPRLYLPFMTFEKTCTRVDAMSASRPVTAQVEAGSNLVEQLALGLRRRDKVGDEDAIDFCRVGRRAHAQVRDDAHLALLVEARLAAQRALFDVDDWVQRRRVSAPGNAA